jgi:hypothetical protein
MDRVVNSPVDLQSATWDRGGSACMSPEVLKKKIPADLRRQGTNAG